MAGAAVWLELEEGATRRLLLELEVVRWRLEGELEAKEEAAMLPALIKDLGDTFLVGSIWVGMLLVLASISTPSSPTSNGSICKRGMRCLMIQLR